MASAIARTFGRWPASPRCTSNALRRSKAARRLEQSISVKDGDAAMTNREKEAFFKALDRLYDSCIALRDSIRKERESTEQRESMIEPRKPAELGGVRDQVLDEALKSLAHDLQEINRNGERNSERIHALLRIAEAHDRPHPN